MPLEMPDSVRNSLREQLDEHHSTRLHEARESYDKIVNRLWAGNAGGAVIVLTALREPLHRLYLIPLVVFVIGLLILSVGAFLDLRFRRQELQAMEDALGQENGTILSLKSAFFGRPSDQGWLTWIDKAAVVIFFIGLFAGLIVVLYVGLLVSTQNTDVSFSRI
jgi:hypothetical protein